MPDKISDLPNRIPYSIWDTRTIDNHLGMKVTNNDLSNGANMYLDEIDQNQNKNDE